MNKQTDAFLIEKLSSEYKPDRQIAMLHLYENMYDKVKNYIQKNNGSIHEAEDVFQDSLIALFKLARTGKLGSHINLQAYFFTICKNHWLKELQKKKRTVELTDKHENMSNQETQETILLTDERKMLMNKLLQSLGEVCYKVLRLYYTEKKRMKEIASLLSLSNEQAAKDKKASCMKKLRTIVRENPHILELLK